MTHMLDSARRVIRIVDGMTATTLAHDEVRLLAVVKSIEIIGEASTKVGLAAQSLASGIDWRGVRLMRNRLIHGYDTIDVARVWDAIEVDVPPLIRELERVLATPSRSRCENGPSSSPKTRPRFALTDRLPQINRASISHARPAALHCSLNAVLRIGSHHRRIASEHQSLARHQS